MRNAPKLLKMIEEDSEHKGVVQYPYVAGYIGSLLENLEIQFPEVAKYLAERVEIRERFK